jgi:excinuclease ABC subunit C
MTENSPSTGETPLTPALILGGVEVIRAQLRTLPAGPGVYRMLGAQGDVLYVGKAKNLKNRVGSYVNLRQLSQRIGRMASETRSMVFVTTNTEVEALLLEANLIKRFKPPFNILLRDDKSLPYIKIDHHHAWPQLSKHRGARSDGKAEYFGPFAAAGAVNKTLNALEKAFLLRSCSDSVFEGRTRPCLLHQIKRCSAPCVGRISHQDYARLLEEARDFLAGKSQKINRDLARRMEAASKALDFEAAAIYRDRLRALAHVQSHQDINSQAVGDADIFAAHLEGGQACVQVFFFRAGHNWGNRAYFPRHDKSETVAEIMAPFISQFYDDKPPPNLILVSEDFDQRELLAEAMTVKSGHKVSVVLPTRGEKRKLMEMALMNARDALARRFAETSTQNKALAGVADLFDLEAPPRRIEVYDNSHISGTNALGAMIVAGPEGFLKNAYRKFNIKSNDIAPGDDFAMMREVLTRRFGRLLKEDPARGTAAWPDLVLIDGGLGQLGVAVRVLAELGVEDVQLVAIAKGADRNSGREDFYLPGREPFKLPPNNPVLYFLQRLRDEAHRFAIGGHRARRAKDIRRSVLDDLPGIGAARKRALLNHFGSAQAAAAAGVEDLAQVSGISQKMATAIYRFFHERS